MSNNVSKTQNRIGNAEPRKAPLRVASPVKRETIRKKESDI